MNTKNNQTTLKGIDATMIQSNFTDIVFQLTDEVGLTNLAAEIDVDPATLSRFRSGQCGLPLSSLTRMMEYGQVVLITKERYKRLVSAGITMSELAKEAMGL